MISISHQELANFHLSLHTDVDCQIVNMNTDGVLDPDVAVRPVMETDTADLNVLRLSEDKELWAAVLVVAE